MKTKTITAIACIATLAALTTQAQTLPKVKEFGVGFSNFDNFSLQYRWGNEHRLYRIVGSIGGYGSTGSSSNDYSSYYNASPNSVSTGTTKTDVPVSISAGLRFSILNLKPLDDHFGFFYGPSIGVSYSYIKTKAISNGITTTYFSNGNYSTTDITNQTQTAQTQSIGPNVGLSLGGYYKVTPNFWLYAEITPNIYYTFSNGKNANDNTDLTTNSTMTHNGSSNHSHQAGISSLSNSGAMITLVYHFSK